MASRTRLKGSPTQNEHTMQTVALQTFGGPVGLMEKLKELYDEAEGIPIKLRIIELIMGLIRSTSESDEDKTDQETESDMEAVAKLLMQTTPS